MIESTIVVGPFQCNCRIVACPDTGEAALIDPGADSDLIIRKIEELQGRYQKKIKVRYILHTHGHLDHIGATREMRQYLDEKQISIQADICLHRDDEFLYQNLKTQGKMFGQSLNDPMNIEHYLEHEEEIRLGKLKLSVIHTPGHSPGSVSLRLHEDTELNASERVFSGDTLFQGSIGNTDFWGADRKLLLKSIKTRLFTLDDDTLVCPGHGPNTLIGIEKRDILSKS